MFVLAGPLELISVVSNLCQKAPALAPRHFPLLHFRLIYAEFARVTDGTRTRDLRSHNPYEHVRVRHMLSRYVALVCRKPGLHTAECPCKSGSVLASIAATLLPRQGLSAAS